MNPFSGHLFFLKLVRHFLTQADNSESFTRVVIFLRRAWWMVDTGGHYLMEYASLQNSAGTKASGLLVATKIVVGFNTTDSEFRPPASLRCILQMSSLVIHILHPSIIILPTDHWCSIASSILHRPISIPMPMLLLLVLCCCRNTKITISTTTTTFTPKSLPLFDSWLIVRCQSWLIECCWLFT